MNLDSRIFLFVVGRLFFRRLIWPLGLLLIAVSLLDSNISWTMLRDQIAHLEPWQITLIFTTLIVSWCMTAGRALRPVWHQPAIAFLVRQPISHWYWVWHLLPSLSIAFLPVVAIWWLAPHYAHSFVHYLGFAGLGWTVILGASFHNFSSLKFITIGSLSMLALIFGYATRFEVAYASILVSILLLPVAISGIKDELVQSMRTGSGHLASALPIIAIMRRDLLCVWRSERKSLLSLILPSVISALMMFALRVNGEVGGRQAFTFACGLLAFAFMPIFELLARLKTRLGSEFMRQRWPVNHSDRAYALLCFMVLLTAPSILALTLLGSTMGLAYVLLFLLFAISLIVSLTALFAKSLIVSTPMQGWALWLLVIHTLAAVTLPSLAYLTIAAAMLALGRSMILKGLRMFTHQSELGNLDQYA